MWDLPGPVIKPMSPALAGIFFTPSHLEALVPFSRWRNLKILLRQSEEMRLLDFCCFSHLFIVVSATLTSTQWSPVNFPNQVFEKNLAFRKTIFLGYSHSPLFIHLLFPSTKSNPCEGRTLSVLLTVSLEPMTVPVGGLDRHLMSE